MVVVLPNKKAPKTPPCKMYTAKASSECYIMTKHRIPDIFSVNIL